MCDMCFDLDSSPPILALAGAAVDHASLTLNAADGNEFRVFHAWPAKPTGKAIVILPDVRGLHHYYEELATRFAEIGVEAIALDYFGRTAGTGDRGDDFDYGPHVTRTKWAGLSADIAAAAAYLRSDAGHGVRSIYSIGFCMGGRTSFLATTLGLGLAGGIGFYGFPGGPSRNDTPAPMDVVGKMECPILGIFGGADGAIPVATVQEFRDALTAAHVDNDIVVEPDAPHSFFDRKQAEFQTQSDDAWARIQKFVGAGAR
jgi:carboxymethylenebutenolidase